ncbi:MAG TPA: rhomboid family intramembrane serine protease [Paenibacillus sp.]|uniref:rhomboid family intramembrane serine protease n=1 Tax=Paenibacillus sp. TaxID=58172 RepID=UPI0028D1F681|nr:rhomboid family intramembrane serine protease [Paenibacillus sp.]HUC93537.1 rhomboid family intramembrane serine protease [Paenibacillus sp.]
MIFLRYESFRSYVRLYPVTAAILAVNLMVFIADWLFLGRLLTMWGMFYQEPGNNLFGLQQPWRYATSIVLHAGWQHLLFNSFSILVFAPPLERLLGHARYLLFYIMAGILANAVSAVVYAGSEQLSVGASGSIYGIFGAYLYMAVFRKYAMDEASRKTVYTILVFGLIYSVLSPNINIWAHIGGGIAGFVMMGMFVRGRKRS